MSTEPTVPVMRARILALSRALGSPITVETREEGDSAEDCLVEMATRRLAFIPKREVVATSITYNGEHCGNVFTDRDHAYVRMRTLNKNYPESHRELVDLVPAGTFDMLEHLERQRNFSQRTFGPGMRTQGVVDHIRKELIEILSRPADISEWIDVAILALDGAWRCGVTAENPNGNPPDQILAALVAKQAKNEGREWPDWRTMPADQAIEHVRFIDATRSALTLDRPVTFGGCSMCGSPGCVAGECNRNVPLSSPAIKVFKLDDYDWWAGENLTDVIAAAREQCGADTYEDAETEAFEVSGEAMQTLRYVEEDGTERTFAEELQRMIDADIFFPCLFASTEY